MNNISGKNQFEIQAKEYIKKIEDLQFENSLLSQKNKLLEKQLESLTNKYNDLKKEIFDIEEHINFCKENQLDLINLNQKDNIGNIKEINQQNFNIFKNKIKLLFEYDENFMKTDSEEVVFNMIIDNINNIKNENLNLRKTLEDLKKIMESNNKNNNMNVYNNIDTNNINNFNEINNEQSFNYNKNNIGMVNDGFTYDITTDLDNNYDLNNDNFNNMNKSKTLKKDLNILMNNIDNLNNALKTDKVNYDLPKSNRNNFYSSYLNRPHKYHKYI
jgi:hypothetical protein